MQYLRHLIYLSIGLVDIMAQRRYVTFVTAPFCPINTKYHRPVMIGTVFMIVHEFNQRFVISLYDQPWAPILGTVCRNDADHQPAPSQSTDCRGVA